MNLNIPEYEDIPCFVAARDGAIRYIPRAKPKTGAGTNLLLIILLYPAGWERTFIGIRGIRVVRRWIRHDAMVE